jgi:hypothetical protein
MKSKSRTTKMTSRFRPTFVVTVTPTEIASSDTSTGQPYSALKDAVISQDGKADMVRTVVAFGPASRIAEALQPGVPIRLAVRFDGGSLKLIGHPRPAACAN